MVSSETRFDSPAQIGGHQNTFDNTDNLEEGSARDALQPLFSAKDLLDEHQ
jgi:hypothetical protein